MGVRGASDPSYEDAFSGFSDDIVIIVGSALLVSAGVARSGVMEAVLQRYAPNVKRVWMQLLLLVGVVTVPSAFVKNIGVLAIMIPIAFQFAGRSGVPASVFLMPMAFGSLLGGLMTQIGASPNIVVSRMRQKLTGESFGMFDFTPVGAALAVVGLVFLTAFYSLVPARTRETGTIHEALEIENYLAEAEVLSSSAVPGKPLSELLDFANGEARRDLDRLGEGQAHRAASRRHPTPRRRPAHRGRPCRSRQDGRARKAQCDRRAPTERAVAA